MLSRVATSINSLKELTELTRRFERLESRLELQRADYERQLETLRRQVARLADGHKLTGSQVEEGEIFGVVPASDLERFVEYTPDITVLDVRTQGEWDSGHIPGALHVPLDQLESRGSDLPDRDTTILCFCAVGQRSAMAAQMLAEQGFTGVYNASGGMAAWTGDVQSAGEAPSHEPVIRPMNGTAPAGGADPVSQLSKPMPSGNVYGDEPLVVTDVEPTPNPNALKFNLKGAPIVGAPRPYENAEQARDDLLATDVFAIQGVETVYVTRSFVNVNKNDEISWEELIPKIKAAIEAHDVDTASIGAIEEKAPEPVSTGDADQDDLLTRINDVLDEKVRPALAGDGGGLEVIGLEGYDLTIRYQGACGSCPSATAGTIMAITSLLQEDVDNRLQVFST